MDCIFDVDLSRKQIVLRHTKIGKVRVIPLCSAMVLILIAKASVSWAIWPFAADSPGTVSMHIRSDMTAAEKVLLGYLRWRCPNHTITNVSEAAFHMNYSRRQIQRVLKALTEQGKLVRKGKGQYSLKESS